MEHNFAIVGTLAYLIDGSQIIVNETECYSAIINSSKSITYGK